MLLFSKGLNQILSAFIVFFHSIPQNASIKEKKMQNKLYTNQDQFDNNFHK